MSGCAIYQWLTNSDFLIHSLFPGATVIEAGVDDPVDEVLSKLPVDAGSFAFHLNCTETARFPLSRAELIESLKARGVAPINGEATDISKRNVQRICAALGLNTTIVTLEGDPEEIVIVKTNLNFGGDSEWALTREDRARMGMQPGTELMWKPNDYLVAPRKQIPTEWWADENLICERFIANRDNRCYRAYVLGSRMAACQLTNPHQIKKMDSSVLERTGFVTITGDEGAEVGDGEHWPAALLNALVRFINKFRLEFGTVDVMESDLEEFYIIDVNTTPAYRFQIPCLVEHLRGKGDFSTA